VSNDVYVFAMRRMLCVDTTTSEGDWADRKDDFLAELKAQFPLEQLAASKVSFDFFTSSQGVGIRAFLQRTPQSLLLTEDGIAPALDPFEADKELIKRSAAQLREEFEEALKGGADPAVDAALARRRWLITEYKASKELLLFTSPDGERMPLHDVPALLPHSLVVQIEFGVDGMERDECKVQIQRIEMVTGASVHVGDQRLAMLKKKVKLIRTRSAKGVKAGAVFALGLDALIPLRVNARIDFCWIDGSVKRWSVFDSPVLAVPTDSGALTQAGG